MNGFVLVFAIFYLSIANAFTASVDVWKTPFGSGLAPIKSQYKSLFTKNNKNIKLCASLPNNSMIYWQTIAWGLKKQANAAKVEIDIYYAGDTEPLETQRNQIKKCTDKADAIIVASLTYDLLNRFYKEISINKPIIALSNDIIDNGIFAKSVVNYNLLGVLLGKEIVRYYKGKEIKAALLLNNPKYSNKSEKAENGIKSALEETQIKLIDIVYTAALDTAKIKATESIIHRHKDLNLIISDGQGAFAALNVLKNKNITNIDIASLQLNAPVYKAMIAGDIALSSLDSPVLQAKIAVDQALRIVKGKGLLRFVSPRLYVATKDNIKKYRLYDLKKFIASSQLKG